MTDPGTEAILAAIDAHSAAIRLDIQRLEKRLDKSLGSLTLEIGEYRRVAMDLFNQLLEVAIVQQRMKEELTDLEARVRLNGSNGQAAAQSD